MCVIEVPWRDAGCLCVASHWPTSALYLAASPGFFSRLQSFLKVFPVDSLVLFLRSIAAWFVVPAEVVSARETAVIRWESPGWDTEGFLGVFLQVWGRRAEWKPDLHTAPTRRKQLSLAESSPVGERRQLWFFFLWFCVVPSCLKSIFPAVGETKTRKPKFCGWNL